MHKHSLDFRCSETFLRNGLYSNNKFDFPIIRKQSIDLTDCILKPASEVKINDTIPKDKNVGIHFFVDDYRFNSYYEHYERYVDRLKQYNFVLSPDFSLYSEMSLWRQVESIGKSRWCGAYWQSQNIKVIPTISWGLSETYDFCFCGIEKGTTVAVGTIGCLKSKYRFLCGYNKMLEVLNPSSILCIGKPFPEMKGKLIVVNYNGKGKLEVK